jgi:Xaa-Pro aminopeptidase
MLGFQTLTLAPIDRRLIVVEMLSPAERAQMDAYHARVLAEVGPRVDGEARAWMEEACAPL